ncbi:rh50 isoform b [Anaeramoeba flamelloides]|uniref:Rh50 isoform b n=1 Tax=Anaeramoeba flamelloides TaxID=1746091 RepID=A0AAV8A0W9_9EUKA|nr:rh50 isoform b [Anaeramoeba flamelloides]
MGVQPSFLFLLAFAQIFILIITCVWFQYDDTYTTPIEFTKYTTQEEYEELFQETPYLDPTTERYFLYFINISLLILIGIGLRLSYLWNYSRSGLCYTFFITVFCLQFTIVCNALFEQSNDGEFSKYKLSLTTLIEGLFGSLTMVIAFGALLGRITLLQLFVVAVFGCFGYSLNRYITILHYGAIDLGGSMLIHMFGSIYGITISFFISKMKSLNHRMNASEAITDIFSLIGTLFMWILFPSLNAALAIPSGKYRAIINTFFALVTCTLIVYAMSLLFHKFKFSVIDVRNSTLAGGVAIATCAHLYISPIGSLIIGLVTGFFVAIGTSLLQPTLKQIIGFQDTVGVGTLHLIPGIIGGFSGMIATAIGENDKTVYNGAYENIFPKGDDQLKYQFICLVTSLGMAILFGIISGFVIRFFSIKPRNYFNDSEHFLEESFDFSSQKSSPKPNQQLKNNNLKNKESSKFEFKPDHHSEDHQLNSSLTEFSSDNK